MNLLELLLLLILNELVILGVWTATSPGMILDTLGDYGDSLLPDPATKCLYNCPPCMASIWSIPVFWLTQPWTLESLITWPFYTLALCGLGKLIVSFLPEQE